MNQPFAPFFGTGTRPELFAQLESVYTAEPVIKPNGLLEVTGYYPTKGKRFHFQHRYVQEAGKWKLAGLHESTGPPQHQAACRSAIDSARNLQRQTRLHRNPTSAILMPHPTLGLNSS